MNFVQQLEECLRDLAAEARSRGSRDLPGVKEASERATLRLRNLQGRYVAAVRLAANSPEHRQHPTTATFRSSEILHPFLLAANYPNADHKLLAISFRAMRLLMEADAVVPADAVHIVRVYQIQAGVVSAYYHRHASSGGASAAEEVGADGAVAADAAGCDGGGSLDAASVHRKRPERSTAGSGSSSWFSWSSSRAVAAATTATHAEGSSSSSKHVRNAVSSSTGQTGTEKGQSAAHMERLALEILSSLLQLLQLLRNYPAEQTVELWTNATALACLWLQRRPPHHHQQHLSGGGGKGKSIVKNTVQQASHTTVSQIVLLLFQTAAASGSATAAPGNKSNVVSSAVAKLVPQTWEDLLTLAAGSSSSGTCQGAFRLCRAAGTSGAGGSSTTALPPPSEFALELMTEIWKQERQQSSAEVRDGNRAAAVSVPFQPAESVMVKTLGVTMTLLQQIPKQPVEKSLRVIQWTLALLESHAAQYPGECRELFAHYLLKPLQTAAEACRRHHDFEDGYVYTALPDSGDAEAVSLAIDAKSNHHDPTDAGPRETAAKKKRSTVFPATVLWKAAFVLEAIYHILDQDESNSVLSVLLFQDGGATLSALTEALSDFATIGTSCRDHILQVVEFCIQHQSTLSNRKPTVFRKAEQMIAAGTSSAVFVDADSGSNTSGSSRSSDRSKSVPPILGEAIWIALQSILRLIDCLRSSYDPNSLLQEIFSPSLAVLQHFLKRFVGCDELIMLSLQGYFILADVCLPIDECTVQRKVLLTSLSKLSLPSWGKHDSSVQLQDHHVQSLLCLLRVVHKHYDSISSEWDIILWTFEELSVLAIASPLLSDEVYHTALAIAAVYSRFAGFSTCFSNESLTRMAEALVEICESTMEKRDVVGDSETVLPERSVASEVAPDRLSKDEARESISGKIMSMGVRAIYGSTAGGDSERQDNAPRVERTKNLYYHDYRNDFQRRIGSSKAAVRLHSVGRIPFALMLLSDVAMANLFRQKECGETILTQFSRLAASTPAIRPFVTDMTTMLTLAQVSQEEQLPTEFMGRGKVVLDSPMQSQLLAVEPAEESSDQNGRGNTRISQVESLKPLCESIRSTDKADVAMSSLGVLNSVLEGTGQNLSGEVWSMIIDSIASLSGGSSHGVVRSSSEWSGCCLSAFRSLKLIVDDFLECLPSETASESLLDCCSSFVESRHDINTSLTAIGLLWTIADQDSHSDSIDKALSKLVLLSSDSRPEVRNAAVNTLFSFIAGRGSSFSPSYWKSCLTETIFGVYDIVVSKARSGGEESNHSEETSSRYSISLHHSRDSADKQWIATQVIVLRGLTRVLRNYFPQLLDTVDPEDPVDNDGTPWFQDAWTRILDFAFEAACQEGGSREKLDIRSVGVDLLVVCCQLASARGIQAATTPARVGTNMEVINGALRSVRETPTAKVTLTHSHSMATDLARQTLFLEAFENLESFEKAFAKKGKKPDDADIQVLHKFCSSLARLYDCCKGSEFTSNIFVWIKRMSADADGETHGAPGDDLEGRFVRIVVTVLEASGGDIKARFLNQSQRASLDLLRSMASDGSPASFDRLVLLAGPGFFVRKDSEGDESEAFEPDPSPAPSLLNFEAASAVSHEASKDTISDECRVLVLYEVLVLFLSEYEDVSPDRNKETRRRRYYKNFVPIIVSGLNSAAKLAERTEEEYIRAISLVWSSFCRCLSQMLTPIQLGKDLIKITRVPEILEMLDAATSNVSPRYSANLCAILTEAASRSFDAAKQHAVNAAASRDTEMGRKSKKHRDELLKLFSSCFSGSCALRPEDANIGDIADMVFRGALDDDDVPSQQVSVEASVIICQALRDHSNMEPLVISVFSALCHLVISDSAMLREAASKVFAEVNIAETLQSSRTRSENAERRAEQAEGRVRELEAAVQELQKEKSKLQQDVAVLEARPM